MARSRLPRRGRAEARLDPVRWRRPGRGSLIRLASITALLVTAVLILWSGPETCAPPPTPAAGSTAARSAAAASQNASAHGQDSALPKPVDSGGSSRATVPAGTVGVAVRLAEPTALALIHPGDRVDLLRVGDDIHEPSAVAAAALVLSVTGADDPTTGGLLVALTPAEAATAVAQPGRGFAVLIRP